LISSCPAERPNLIDAKKVEKIQDIYINALRSYEESKRSKPALSFAKLLAVLPQLRTLGNINSEICFSLKIQNKKIPPFLAEIWDV
jgi:ecdysone receptor